LTLIVFGLILEAIIMEWITFPLNSMTFFIEIDSFYFSGTKSKIPSILLNKLYFIHNYRDRIC
jgi:hypothetical protein